MSTSAVQKQESTGRLFARYVSLNVLGMIGLSCYILADTFFVSAALGVNGLTALNLAIPVYSVINGTGLMIGMGGATRYAMAGGPAKSEKRNRIFSNAALLAVLAAAMFVLTGLLFSGGISTLLGADAAVYEMTNMYLKTLLLFAPAFLLNNVLICFIRNDGNPDLSMTAMLVGSASNIVLDYVFMFPLKMGIFGAAFATGLAPLISIGVLSLHFTKKKNSFIYKKQWITFRQAKDYMALGISSFITEVSSGLVIIILNIIILRLEGNTGVAAYGIIANLALVVLAVFTGVGQGIQPLISRFYGEGRHHDIKKIYRYAIISVVVIAAVVYAAASGCAEGITAIFNSEQDEQLAEIAVKGLRLYFTGFVFAGFNIVTAVYLSAMAKAAKSFWISISRGFLIIIPMSMTLAFLYRMQGVWLAFTVTELLTAVAALLMINRKGKSKKNQH